MTTASMLLAAVLVAYDGTHHVPHIHQPITIPTKLTAGDQLYQGNLSGFRRYLDGIQQTDRELFLLLDPQLRQLEEQERLAWVVGLGGIGAGIAMACSGVFSDRAPISSGTANAGASTDALLLSAGGILVAAGSIGAFYLLQPSSDQLLGIINLHNRVRAERPLRLQLGFAPVTRGHGGVALAFATF